MRFTVLSLIALGLLCLVGCQPSETPPPKPTPKGQPDQAPGPGATSPKDLPPDEKELIAAVTKRIRYLGGTLKTDASNNVTEVDLDGRQTTDADLEMLDTEYSEQMTLTKLPLFAEEMKGADRLWRLEKILFEPD